MAVYFPGDRVITDGGGFYLDDYLPVPEGAVGTVTWGNHEDHEGVPTLYGVELDVLPDSSLLFYASEILGLVVPDE